MKGVLVLIGISTALNLYAQDFSIPKSIIGKSIPINISVKENENRHEMITPSSIERIGKNIVLTELEIELPILNEDNLSYTVQTNQTQNWKYQESGSDNNIIQLVMDIPNLWYSVSFQIPDKDIVREHETLGPCEYLPSEKLPVNSKINELANGVLKAQILSHEKNTKSEGTFFCVSEDGLVLSNDHVFKSGQNSNRYHLVINSISRDGIPTKDIGLEVLLQSPEYDFVLAQISEEKNNICRGSKIELGFEEPKKDSKISIIGYPGFLGGIQTVSYGEIQEGFQDSGLIVNAPVSSGNSGGPIIDSNGKAIGIINSSYSLSEGSISSGYSFKEIEDSYPLSQFISGVAQDRIQIIFNLLESPEVSQDEKIKLIEEYETFRTPYQADRIKKLIINEDSPLLRKVLIQTLERIQILAN